MNTSEPRHYKRIFVLGANVEKNASNELVLAKTDKGGSLLSEWRLKAAKKILECKMADKIVIVGAREDGISNQEIWRSEVMRDLLIKKYGADSNLVEARKQTEKGTKGNVIEINKYLSENKLVAGECAFLTNFYHIPRAITFFLECGLILRPIAAECFLVSDEADAIKSDYSTNNFSGRLTNELNGLCASEFDKYQ